MPGLCGKEGDGPLEHSPPSCPVAPKKAQVRFATQTPASGPPLVSQKEPAVQLQGIDAPVHVLMTDLPHALAGHTAVFTQHVPASGPFTMAPIPLVHTP